MYGFDWVNRIIYGMFFACCVFVPLGMWKLIEIMIWIFKHIYIGVK